MPRPTPEWREYCVLEYIKKQARYSAETKSMSERIRTLRERMEGVTAVRYDRDGSSSGYSDKFPEIMDTLEAIRDALASRISLGEMEYQQAIDLFREYSFAEAVWLHYGCGKSWNQVGREVGYSSNTCKHHRLDGIEYIYDRMPAEYRQVRQRAEV